MNEKMVHQGIAAAVWPLDPPHFDLFLDSIKSRLDQRNPAAVRLLLLDQISDPRNFGAIMRSAQAFGVTGVITTFRNAANENGVLARAASGALDHVPLIRVVNLAASNRTNTVSWIFCRRSCWRRQHRREQPWPA